MKRYVVLLFVLLLASEANDSFSQILKRGGSYSGKKSVENEINQDNTATTTFATNSSLFLSVDLGRAGLQIPAFTDLNATPQDAYKIKSHDFMVQIGGERKLAKSPIHGPVVFGIKGKVGLAYTYWPTQQGGGEPGNYFASNGSFTNAGNYLHSGDAINIKGIRWTLAPDLTAHYSIGSNVEIGAAAGPCFYGYALMTIKDPWTGFSTSISDDTYVWHSQFLKDHFHSFSVTADWSANIAIRGRDNLHKVFFEVGMTGTAFNYGIGIIHPIIKKI